MWSVSAWYRVSDGSQQDIQRGEAGHQLTAGCFGGIVLAKASTTAIKPPEHERLFRLLTLDLPNGSKGLKRITVREFYLLDIRKLRFVSENMEHD
jgi:hypothetical protein